MSKKCFVSFAATGREYYNKAQLRLIRSLVERGWPGDYIIRSYDGDCDEYLGVKIKLNSYPPPAINNHAEIPYGFKVDIIKEAMDAGYDEVTWGDSTICMVKPPEQAWEHAKQYGVAAYHNLGHPLWKWVSDNALKQQRLTEYLLKDIEQIMACCITFNFANETGKRIFDDWYKASRDGVSFQNYGSTREGFIAHRHDQAVLSMLLYKYHIPLLPYGKLVYQPHDTDFAYGNEFEFINKGVDQPL